MRINDTKKQVLAAAITVAVGLSQAAQGQIEEIIVTANKRAESINDVGMSIRALSADTMEKQRIISLEDLALATPGLSYSPSTSNTPIFTLRGVGFNESALGVYPAVSVYLDQAPLTFPVLAANAAYDLERVEVLKGPQGILFGQNSTGGAINYIAAKPTEEFEAGVGMTYGRFNLIEVDGHVSGPLSDEIRARLAFKVHQMDEWQQNTFNGDENGAEDTYAGRLSVEWAPTDAATLSLVLNGWRDKTDPQAMQTAAVFPQTPSEVHPEVLAVEFLPQEPREAAWSPGFEPESDRELQQAVIRGEFAINDSLLFTSLSSIVTFEQTQNTDGDGAIPITYDLISSEGKIDTFSQEFRLESTDSSAFRWVVGANYEKSEVDEVTVLAYGDNSTSNPGNNDIIQSGINFSTEMENYAFFGNVDYFLTEKATLKVGARYTSSEISADICNFDVGDGRLGDLFTLLGQIFNGATVPLDTGDCYTLNEDNLPGEVYSDTLDEENTSWRIGLDYKATDDILLYASASKGYKAGSYSNIAASTFSQYHPVTQESVLAYEIGAKSTLFDRKLALNAAIFQYEYEDKQIKGKVSTPVFGVLEILRNVPKSKINGAEIEATYRPITNLTLSLAATYIDSEVKEGPADAVNIIGESAEFDGVDIPFTPHWQTTASVDYEWEMGSVIPFVGMTINYRGDSDATLGGSSITLPDSTLNRTLEGGENPYLLEEYSTIDLRAGITAADDSWRLTLWGKNVTDEYYWSNIIPGSDIIGRFAGRPATYGVTFNYNF